MTTTIVIVLLVLLAGIAVLVALARGAATRAGRGVSHRPHRTADQVMPSVWAGSSGGDGGSSCGGSFGGGSFGGGGFGGDGGGGGGC